MTDSQVLRLSRLDVRDVSDALDKLQLSGLVTGLLRRSSAPGGISRTYNTLRVCHALRLLMGLPSPSSWYDL